MLWNLQAVTKVQNTDLLSQDTEKSFGEKDH